MDVYIDLLTNHSVSAERILVPTELDSEAVQRLQHRMEKPINA
jgi:hypothetical protein